ncbi:MAG: ATP-binding cassette domain-containing protein [Ferruginibacter sp.]|nr:ATP-binding cassette domain-containing protein [Ferruginibacter sp.]
MQIALQKVLPVFFEENKNDGSQVWNKIVSFSKGQNIHIIAPSGSGKTTLIHFLYGLRNDYSGHILYDANDIKHFDAEKFSIWRKQHISIVFQDLRLFPEQTILQNLEIKRVLSSFQAAENIAAMAERLGIKTKLHQLCKNCSYGEQQRAAIIRALQQPFDFLLLDEPFSHLDELNRVKAMELMEEESKKRNATIILADLREIEYFKSEITLHL